MTEIMVVMGTRPEIIKMAQLSELYKNLDKNSLLSTAVNIMIIIYPKNLLRS